MGCLLVVFAALLCLCVQWKVFPIGPLAQWRKDLTYYLTPFFCLVNWDMHYPGSTCQGTDLLSGRSLYIHTHTCNLYQDHLFGIVVSTSDCHPRGPGFDSRLYPGYFSGSIGSGTGSTQPREDNWMRSSEIRLRILKLRLRDKCFANHEAPWLPSGTNHISRSWLFRAVVPRI